MTEEKKTRELSLPSAVQARMIDVMGSKPTPLKVAFHIHGGAVVEAVAHDPEYIEIAESDWRAFNYNDIDDIKLVR